MAPQVVSALGRVVAVACLTGCVSDFGDPLLVKEYIPISGHEGRPVFAPKPGPVSGGESAYFPHVFGSLLPVYTAKPAPSVSNAVIVLSEWWGPSNTELDLARRLAAMGYMAVVPSSYREEVPFDARLDLAADPAAVVASVSSEVTAAAWKMKSLAWGAQAHAVVQLASHLKTVGVRSVALLGFSEGACLSLVAASQESGGLIDGVVAFYGSPLADGERFVGNASQYFQAGAVQQPVMLITGSKDPFTGFSDPASMLKVQQAIGTRRAQFVEIPDVDHGFMSKASWWEAWKAAQKPPRVPFSQEAFDTAWVHTRDFLGALFSYPSLLMS